MVVVGGEANRPGLSKVTAVLPCPPVEALQIGFSMPVASPLTFLQSAVGFHTARVQTAYRMVSKQRERARHAVRSREHCTVLAVQCMQQCMQQLGSSFSPAYFVRGDPARAFRDAWQGMVMSGLS